MKRFAIAATAILVSHAAFAQQATTPDQRLALEIAQLHLRNAYLATDLEKAKAEIEALKAKIAPAAAPKE